MDKNIPNQPATVYFIKEITPANVVKMYQAVGKKLPEPVACKVHSGEKGGINFLRPEYFKDIMSHVNGTICECNAAYEGARNTSELHWDLMKYHKWIDTFGNDKIDIMDEDPTQDVELDIPDGFKIKKNYVGSHMQNYKSMLVLARFKAHGMGGFGGALKQLSIGCGSSAGKAYQHTAGKTKDPAEMRQHYATSDDFMDSVRK
ncbi:MAG: DUF362 domain-containing protein [archaeon]|nr:DUF362 domain-containing protein [archaeon]